MLKVVSFWLCGLERARPMYEKSLTRPKNELSYSKRRQRQWHRWFNKSCIQPFAHRDRHHKCKENNLHYRCYKLTWYYWLCPIATEKIGSTDLHPTSQWSFDEASMKLLCYISSKHVCTDCAKEINLEALGCHTMDLSGVDITKIYQRACK